MRIVYSTGEGDLTAGMVGVEPLHGDARATLEMRRFGGELDNFISILTMGNRSWPLDLLFPKCHLSAAAASPWSDAFRKWQAEASATSQT